MSLDPTAARIADEQLWKAHPELGRRRLTPGPVDAKYRQAWHTYYNEAVARQAPPPQKRPEPTPILPPPTDASKLVAKCQPTPTKKKVEDCKAIKNHVREGDVVLRSTPGAESDLIRKAGRCDYSHAGIVTENAAGELVVVDAYPRHSKKDDKKDTSTGDVGEEPIDDFFCGHDTLKGLVARPKNCELGEKAAAWAMEQTKNPDYQFDIFNPWNRDPKQLYCSDFVYQAYQNAGVELVSEKMDFLSPDNRENTLEAVREYKGGLARVVSDDKLEGELRKKAGSSEYITPCQVAVNDHMDTVVDFEPPPL